MENDTVCPTCGRSDFSTSQAMKLHHNRAHGESIAGVVVECENCSNTYREEPSRAEKYNDHFCNRKCRAEYDSERYSGEGHPQWQGRGFVEVQCDYCGDKTTKSKVKYERNTHNFCSEGCRNEWMSETLTGPRSSRWLGGYEGYYGESWDVQRKKALERDNHTCQSCGSTKKEIGQEPNVHHREPFRNYGVENHEEANRLENLVCLCNSCHASWENIPVQIEVPT